MNNEIKEILAYFEEYIKITDMHDSEPMLNWKDLKIVLDYITNLQQENERLKKALNCKEYFSSTMPEDTEFVILTKNNYDRQQKDIQFELIDYKTRCEKAIEYINRHKEKLHHSFDEPDCDYWIATNPDNLLNILQNGSDSQ